MELVCDMGFTYNKSRESKTTSKKRMMNKMGIFGRIGKAPSVPLGYVNIKGKKAEINFDKIDNPVEAYMVSGENAEDVVALEMFAKYGMAPKETTVEGTIGDKASFESHTETGKKGAEIEGKIAGVSFEKETKFSVLSAINATLDLATGGKNAEIKGKTKGKVSDNNKTRINTECTIILNSMDSAEGKDKTTTISRGMIGSMPFRETVVIDPVNSVVKRDGEISGFKYQTVLMKVSDGMYKEVGNSDAGEIDKTIVRDLDGSFVYGGNIAGIPVNGKISFK